MSYYDIARARLSALQQAREATVLSIETSCDETAAALVKNGRQVLSNAVYTQIPIHRKFGGVVPELASRNHVDQVGPVVESALSDAGMTLVDVDAIAVTGGPGLVGALLVGVSYAKGLAFATGKPLINTHHILGHIAANYLTFPDLQPPFTCLVASGGHSHIIEVADYDRCVLLGRTRDDAAGEAYDKVARVLELPGAGAAVSRRAGAGEAGAGGGPPRHSLPLRLQRGGGLRHELFRPQDRGHQPSVERQTAGGGSKPGGRGRQLPVRRELHPLRQGRPGRRGERPWRPGPGRRRVRQDNGAMIGSAAFYLLMKGHIADLSFNAVPYLPIA